MENQLSLAALAGAVLAVFFDWFPWVNAKFDQLEEQGKRIVMLVALFLITGAVFGLACVPSSPVHMVECSEGGFWELAGMFLAALVTNQSGHSLLKPASKSE